MFRVFPRSSRLKRSQEILLKLFRTYWEQWEHWEQAPEMSDLRGSQLLFGDWEHWEQQWPAPFFETVLKWNRAPSLTKRPGAI